MISDVDIPKVGVEMRMNYDESTQDIWTTHVNYCEKEALDSRDHLHVYHLDHP